MALFDSLKRGANRAAFEADKLVRINRAQAALASLSAQISAKTAVLGGRTLEVHKEGTALPSALAEICNGVSALQTEMEKKERELQQIREETLPAPALRSTSPSAAGEPSFTGFRILEEAGKGGMGVVYRAHQLSVNRTVAIKLLPAHLSADQGFVDRFRRGAEAAARLAHPNVAHIYDFRHEGSLYYIIMEFVEGETLRQRLCSVGRLTIPQAMDIAGQVAQALSVAHGAGVVHRDVKPENIMITPQGLVKVTDFGIAKLAGVSTATVDGSIIGSAYYMAPEQARGDKSIDGRADLYSLGAVMYEMVTAVRPFEGENTVAVISRLLNPEDRPVPPETLNPQVPPWLSQTILRAMETDREKRFASAEELSRVLAQNLAGGLPDAREPLKGRPSVTPDNGDETIVRSPGPHG